VFVGADDTIYVGASFPDTSAKKGELRGIVIGNAIDGSLKAFIPDPCPYPYASASTLAEGVTVDAQGNVYGADVLGTVRKFMRTK